MSTLRIVFLGTSASVPQKGRFLSSIILQRENGEIIVFDCGEGTQYQMMNYNVNLMKITKIFFSHLHGDHLFGIFGLLHTLNQLERTKPLTIFGPIGLKFFFESIINTRKNLGFNYPIEVFEIEQEGLIIDEKDYRIISKKVNHSVLTFAYAFIEKDRLGKFNAEKAVKLKVKKGEKWQKLQHGQSVLSEDNKVILPELVLGPKRRGFKIVIAFDGLYEPEDFTPFASDADVLILEATFSDKQESDAKEKLHSTARWSAQIAKLANVKQLYLTHISPRFKEKDSIEKEAKEIFPEAIVAFDGLEINLNRKDLGKEE